MARKRSIPKSFAKGYRTNLSSGGAAAAKALIKGTNKAAQRAINNSPARKAALAEARKQHRNAGSKITRFEKKGVDIRGSHFDPRVNASDLRKMNTRQLKAYATRVAKFNDRSTQFVPGTNGAPLPASKFATYKELEGKQNARASERAQARGSLKTPQGDMTLDERNAMLAEDHPRMEGTGVRTPFSATNREPSQIPSVQALDKLIANQQKVLRRGHLPKEIRAAKEGLLKIIDEFGDPEMSKLARKLTNNQIDVLWFDMKYAKEIVNPYVQAKMMSAQGRDAEILDALEDDISDIYEALTWASKNVPRTVQRKSQSKG